MSSPTHVGGCFCGAVRYAAQDPSFLCFCYCTSCRRASGALIVAWGTFNYGDFRITRGNLREVATSPGVTRGHCEQCGTTLTYRHQQKDREIDLTLASLDDAAELKPTVHIWVEDKLPWLVIADGLPQYQKGISRAP
ncbi:MAG: GFA family protein [Pseudomonadota bacterium]